MILFTIYDPKIQTNGKLKMFVWFFVSFLYLFCPYFEKSSSDYSLRKRYKFKCIDNLRTCWILEFWTLLISAKFVDISSKNISVNAFLKFTKYVRLKLIHEKKLSIAPSGGSVTVHKYCSLINHLSHTLSQKKSKYSIVTSHTISVYGY